MRKWRRRFAADGLAGLADLSGSGRSKAFTPLQAAEVKALRATRSARIKAFDEGLPGDIVAL